ncbi:HET-domain-containing protein [Acephala macrosclerotiorum]|nr:HET-domain-containing protein [Acephala macrosclerotiorum]
MSTTSISMDVFEVDPDTAVIFNEMSTEDLGDFVNLHNSPDFYRSAENDSDIELCIYACFLIFTRTASTRILERAILSADLWMAATPRDHPHRERRIEILDTMLARKLQGQTEQQVQGELTSQPGLDSISTARLIPRPDHNPFPPHTMLCGTCIHMLSQTLPMSDDSIAFQTSFDQIYLSGVLRYCIICSIFAEAVKNPGSDLHVIHKDWMSSIKENREPKELILAFAVDVSGISGGGGPSLGLTLRNRLRILWQFAGVTGSRLQSNDDLTFLLSPVNLNQPPDASMRYFLVGDTEQKFLRTGRTEKSQYCPFCEPSNNSDSSRPKIALSVKGIDTEDKPNGAFVVDYYRHRFSLSNNTGDDTSWSKALEWLDECSTNHTKCRERREEIRKEWHPTRLLDLCPPTGSHDNLRLILRADDRPSGEYMTLSHCWGKASFLNLTTDNLERFRQGISLHDLPKTFQDAVVITLKLGIRYLWIDSLCIIQSGNMAEADWQHESSTMGKVYFHSFLNIGATGASDGTMGCFRERDYGKVRRPVLAKPDCKTHEQYYQPYYLVEKKFLERNLLAQPLLQRGWVFQE